MTTSPTRTVSGFAPAARAAVDPAEQGVDPGDQLAGAERLGQVVVSADGEPDHQVGLGVAGRQHEDRGRGAPPDLLTLSAPGQEP